MKAVLLDPQRASGVALIDLAGPGMPPAGHVLVHMRLAPINPADRMAVADTYGMPDHRPTVLGAEGMGVVEAVGADVAEVAPGDRVILLSRGNWAERRLVAAGEVLRVPDTLSDEQAAILRINPATAFHMLDRLALRPGDWLIQNAAGSSVARWVRRLAERQGIPTLNIVRADGRHAGSAPVLTDGDDLVARAGNIVGDGQIRGALDAVAGDTTGRMAACLAPEGRLLVFGHLSSDPCRVASTLMTTRSLTIQGFTLRSAEAGTDRAALYADLATLAAESPEPIAAVVPLTEVETALSAPRAGRVLLALGG